MLRSATLLLALVLFTADARAQAVTVETIVPPGSTINDALALGPDGGLYGSLFATNGMVTRVDLDDGSTSIFADGFLAANGLDFDADGNLYVANFGAASRELERIAPDGTRSAYSFAEEGNLSGVLVHPTTGVIYVTNYTEDTVGIAVENDFVTPFLSNEAGAPPKLNGPAGLAVDDAGRLYVANFDDGRIFRVEEDATLTQIADLDGTSTGATGFIAYGGGALFATGIRTHVIERISLEDGNVETIAGTGLAGTADGPGGEAQFDGPNGIVANATGDTLYVSEIGSRAIRRIVIGGATSEETEAPPVHADLALEAYPNPSSTSISLRFRLDRPEQIVVSLYDIRGRRVRHAVASGRASGWQEVNLDVGALAPGLYVADVRGGERRARQKIVVIE